MALSWQFRQMATAANPGCCRNDDVSRHPRHSVEFRLAVTNAHVNCDYFAGNRGYPVILWPTVRPAARPTDLENFTVERGIVQNTSHRCPTEQTGPKQQIWFPSTSYTAQGQNPADGI